MKKLASISKYAFTSSIQNTTPSPGYGGSMIPIRDAVQSAKEYSDYAIPKMMPKPGNWFRTSEGYDTIPTTAARVFNTAVGSALQGVSDAALVGGSHLINVPAGIADGIINLREGKSFWDKGVTGERLDNWHPYTSAPGSGIKYYGDRGGVRTGNYPTTFDRSDPTQEKMYQESVNGITNAIETPAWIAGGFAIPAKRTPRLAKNVPSKATLELTEEGKIPPMPVNPNTLKGNIADADAILRNPTTPGGRIPFEEVRQGDLLFFRQRGMDRAKEFSGKPASLGKRIKEWGQDKTISVGTDSPFSHVEVATPPNNSPDAIADYLQKLQTAYPNTEIDVFRFPNATPEFLETVTSRARSIRTKTPNYPRENFEKYIIPSERADFFGIPLFMRWGSKEIKLPVKGREGVKVLDSVTGKEVVRPMTCGETVGEAYNLQGVDTRKLPPKSLMFLPGLENVGRTRTYAKKDLRSLTDIPNTPVSNFRTSQSIRGAVTTGVRADRMADAAERNQVYLYNSPQAPLPQTTQAPSFRDRVRSPY
jgi:hypothetical protein